MELSPEQFSSLKRVVSEPAAKAAAAMGISVAEVTPVIERLESVVRRHGPALGNARLLVVYMRGQSGRQIWSDALIARLIRSQTLIVKVGNHGSVLGSEAGAVSLVMAAAKSQDGPTMTALCSPGQLCLFAAGKVIAELGTAVPSGHADWRRSWRELRQSLDTHFQHCIENEKQLRYWANKRDRVLLVGPDKTEKLFHHSLFWWCNNFIVDALDVYGETASMGQDKTDITVVTEVGSIVIEVKWLGTNANGMTYAQIRIHEGMIQVAEYLNNNPRLMQGYLVLYDARPRMMHLNGSSYPAHCRHGKCEEPIIYFLRSETPSQLATRLAKETARNQTAP